MRGSLPRSADFARVRQQGRSRAGQALVLVAAPRPDGASERRLGVVVANTVGKATTRTRLKRVMREAYRAVESELPLGHDYVLVARAPLVALDAEQGLAGVRAELAGLLAPPAHKPRKSRSRRERPVPVPRDSKP